MKTGERPATTITTPRAKVTLTREQVISDYRLAVRSRAASELGRREVLIGRAPFGIFGDGKEIANLGMAHAFRPGDWRSGYYRDQTFMLAVGIATLEQYFAQLYADADLGREPFSGGRQMSNHYATRTVDERGHWRDLLSTGQTASDLSPVAAQMPRSVGLAWASKLYRTSPGLRAVAGGFSRNGDEVCFCTIGNAGTSEGLFWESINAAGVLQVPLVVGVWDDGYGISVPNEFQTTKGSISAALAGMQRDSGPGFEIRVAKGWDYLGLIDTFAEVTELARREHVPALVHVVEVTQPQGHSTSGSHERYKPAACASGWCGTRSPTPRHLTSTSAGTGPRSKASASARTRSPRRRYASSATKRRRSSSSRRMRRGRISRRRPRSCAARATRTARSSTRVSFARWWPCVRTAVQRARRSRRSRHGTGARTRTASHRICSAHRTPRRSA